MKKDTLYWLMKTEPSVYSIDDLAKLHVTDWEGVRNFQARNYMKEMQVGDLVLFYHSNAKPSGIAGIARVSKPAFVDYTAFDNSSPYYDSKSTSKNPIWYMVEVEFVKKFKNIISLADLRSNPEFEEFMILKKGSRLSITPVEKKHFDHVLKLSKS